MAASARKTFWDSVLDMLFGRSRRTVSVPRAQPRPPATPPPAQPAPQEDRFDPGPQPQTPELLPDQPAPPELAPTPAPLPPQVFSDLTPFKQRLLSFCESEFTWFRRGQLKEENEPARSRIREYWANVGRPEWDGATPEAWSAAFISFAMKSAGDNGRFKKNTGHCVYINDAILHKDDAAANFQGRRVSEYPPQLGDLIARRRAGSSVTFDTAVSVQWYTSHTDIVTRIENGRVFMIGGNVSNSVSERSLPILPDGRIAPEAATANEVFAIMKNNLV